MQKFLLGMLAAVGIPVAAIAVLLLANSNLRHIAYRAALELPGEGYFFLIRRHVLSRDFAGANRWLEQHLDLVERFSAGRNTLLPGLARNAELAVERARGSADHLALLPFLRRFSSNQPDFFLARIWFARALQFAQPKEAFKQLDAAANMIPADNRPYRIAINLAAKLGLKSTAARWCERYRKAQFGGLDPYWYTTSVVGQGMRRMRLGIVGPDDKELGAVNAGIQLGGKRSYEFTYGNGMEVDKMQLQLGVLPGVSVKIDAIHIISRSVQRSFWPADFVLTSWSGFHLGDNRVLATSKDGETVFIYPAEGSFGTADKVVMDIEFERLAVASPRLCEK